MSPITPGELEIIKQEVKEQPITVSTDQLAPLQPQKATSSVGNMSMAESMDGSFYGAYDNKNVNLHEADNIPVESRPKTAGYLFIYL